MIDKLIAEINQFIPLDEHEITAVGDVFHQKALKKRSYLLKEGAQCEFVAFLAQGCISHYHHYDGKEKTCYVSTEGNWISDTASFSEGTPSSMNFQALEESIVFLIERDALLELYRRMPKFETVSHQVHQRLVKISIELGISLAAYSPEKRYADFVKESPELVQRVPQKYIASMLGIEPESLSRIRKRMAKGPSS